MLGKLTFLFKPQPEKAYILSCPDNFFISWSKNNSLIDAMKNAVGRVVTMEGVLGNIQIADNPAMDVLKPSSFDKYLGI